LLPALTYVLFAIPPRSLLSLEKLRFFASIELTPFLHHGSPLTIPSFFFVYDSADVPAQKIPVLAGDEDVAVEADWEVSRQV
jgi:hypothetical protein